MRIIISVIGGINVDIKGFSKNIIMKNSNPGSIKFSCGGVARNIAENLGRLNIPVKLFGAVGDDFFGNYVIKETKKTGVNTTFIKVSKENQTGIYLSIVNNKDMLVSISDMNSTNYLNKEYIDKNEKDIFNSKYIILDTNLDVEILKYIVYKNIQYKKTLIVNTVSIQKAKKIYNIKNNINYIITNLYEFNSIFNTKINTIEDVKKMSNSESLCDIIITLGENGTFDFKRKKHFKALKANIIDANGAGDAFLSGFVYSLYNNNNIDDSILFGQCAAVITLESKNSVSETLSEETLKHKFYREVIK